jgi:hypothetical protein
LVNERLDTYLQRNLRAFGELNEELVLLYPYVIHKSILVVASLANLHPGHVAARDSVISSLDARLVGRPAFGVPFAQLATMMDQDQPHALHVAPLTTTPTMAPSQPRSPLHYSHASFATLAKGAVTNAV